ncbi:MAG: protein kinase [Acidobacteriota bacterium]
MGQPTDGDARGADGVGGADGERPKASDGAVDTSSHATERHPLRPSAPPPQRRGLFANGDLIADRYEVLRFIARGGIGEVYEVRDRQLGERLALKMLQARESLDEVARERFRREIQLARRVTHPNVCRLYDAGLHGEGDDTQPFCTMELLAGDTLHEHIEKHGPMSEEESLPMLRQMARGLEAAHAKGIIHRDFKSNNVMLVPVDERDSRADADGPWRVVLTDFGLARPETDDDPTLFRTDHSGGVTGTLAFMAPEQLREEAPTLRADLYALGVVLFHMLTGELPFTGSTPINAMVRRLQEPAPSPRERVPNLDRRWEAAVLRLLERAPEDRFDHAWEVVEAVAGDRATTVPSKQRGRRRLALQLAVGAAAVAFAALFWPHRGPLPLVADDPVQLTSEPGLEIDPVISPDGETVAFVSDASGTFELWLKPFPSGEATQLTTDGQRNMQPSWSPDGRHLAYVSQERRGLYVMSLGGGAPRQISTFGSRPAYSPDGRQVVFQSEARKDVSERTLAAMPPSTLWLVEVDPGTGQATGEPRQLTEAGEPTGGHGEPSWSPDGQQLAFSAGNRRRSQIWTLDLETGTHAPLISEARININPLFTPDGYSVIYVGISSQGRQSASYAVWRQPLDRSGAAVGEPQRLTQLGIATIRQLTLAPEGDALVYSALSTVSSLQSLDLDADGRGLGPSRVFTERGQRSSRPAFSPDGQWIAFDRWSKGTNLDLWLRGPLPAAPPDGGESAEPPPPPEERQLTVDAEWDSQAVWLSEGQGLTYFSEREGRRGLWQMFFDAGPETPEARIEFLDAIDIDADWARLSPDASRIAYHSSRESAGLDVWIRDLESGTDTRLTSDPELAGFPIWSPDGTSLAIEIRREGSTHIALLSLLRDADGDYVDLEPLQLTAEEGESWPYSFSPSGDRIAFAGQRDGIWNLYWVRLGDRRIERLTDETSLDGYVRYPAWSPRGDHVLFERTRTVGDLWRVDLRPE